MANPLLDLLSSSAAAGPVMASANSPPAATVPGAGTLMNSTVPPQTYHEQNGKHMGVAGVARDILGTLGDFLLTRLHMPAMYAPAQHDRKLEVAQQNIDSDPVGAIQQVTSIDPVFGAKLRDQYIDNMRQQAGREATKEARDARVAQAQALQDDRTRSRVGAMLGTMANWDDPKRTQNYGAMRQQALQYAKANGLDLSNELPASYDSVALDSFIDGSVPVGTQRAQRLTKDRIDNQDAQAYDRMDVTTRGQDLVHQDRQASNATAQRGQDISSSDRAASRGVTIRGQDLGHADRVRGQDVRSDTTRRGQDMRARPPQEGDRKVVNGVTYIWKGGRAVKE